MKPIVLLDGGTGQEVFRRARQPASPLWSVQVMLERPEIVRAVHEDFIAAGSRVITLNTYTATPTRLRRDGDVSQLERIVACAIGLAREARARAPHAVQIAGCLPPLVASYAPDAALPYAACLAEYRRLVALQADAVDLFLVETIATLDEGRAAVEAARESGKPVLLSFTVSEPDGRALRSGLPLTEAVAGLPRDDLAGVLVNCSTPEAIGQAMGALWAAGLPFGGYANGFTSVDALRPGGTVDVLSARRDLDPATYAAAAMGWVSGGATLVGGCCEVGPDHIAALARRLVADGYTLTGLRGPDGARAGR